jgi:hypothetical protein
MSPKTGPNKNTALALDQKAIQGVNKYFAKAKTLTVAGTSYTPAALKAVLQAEIDAIKALDAAMAQIKQLVAETRAARLEATATRKGLRAHVLGNYGASAVQMLGDFGMAAPKSTGKKTAQVKAEAVTKAKATREARHTMGKKQRLAIKAAPVAVGTPSPQ